MDSRLSFLSPFPHEIIDSPYRFLAESTFPSLPAFVDDFYCIVSLFLFSSSFDNFFGEKEHLVPPCCSLSPFFFLFSTAPPRNPLQRLICVFSPFALFWTASVKFFLPYSYPALSSCFSQFFLFPLPPPSLNFPHPPNYSPTSSFFLCPLPLLYSNRSSFVPKVDAQFHPRISPTLCPPSLFPKPL